ncbi:MAG: histidine kinase [Myxococcota bacterium]|nr:histidine kinase [Myxococcota bacterium]
MCMSLLQWTMLGFGLSLLLGLILSLPDVGLVELSVKTGISFLYAMAIGLPATVIFDRLQPRLHGRPALKQWGTYLGVLLVIVLVASLLVGIVLVLIGIVDSSRLWDVYRNGLVISLAVAVPVTIGAISMSRMQESLHRSQSAATEARLASLESRVRPHFLFNALNSALALIPEEPKRAEDVLERLSGLLRFSLDAQSRLVTLGEELRVVVDYLEIERARFGDRLAYELDVPTELHAREVPAFAVQTLVENSVKYAVSARKDGARIVVRCRGDGERLRIEIADDGPGFSGEIWIPGHGLDGLRSRLDALYGKRAKLIAPARAERGAAVCIEIEAA